uniref:Uncharacterized protein n=1 Tax=Megaselia scalaris TaxID=36166 RepID=T1GKS2_MEGSC
MKFQTNDFTEKFDLKMFHLLIQQDQTT